MPRIQKLQKFLSSDWLIALLLFLLAGGIRAIPEIKAGIWPIGYDTFNTYAAELATYQGPLLAWLKTANLIYFIFWPFKILGAKPDLLIKIFGPLFFSGVVVSFYFWARRFFEFSKTKAFLATCLIIFQLATLRLSWDLYRNELGLIFLFLALINLPKISHLKNFIYFSFLGVLVVLSHELVTVIFLVIGIIYWINLARLKKHQDFLKFTFTLLLVGLTFVIILRSSGQNLYDPHVIFTSEKNYLWRYFYQYQKDISYQTLFLTIGSLFWLYFQFLFAFALYGFWLLRKNLVLTTMTLWLLVGTFSSLIFAGTGIIVWERWLIMLAFPFAIYAVEGIFSLGGILGKIKGWARRFRKLAFALAIIFWLVFISLFVWRAIPFLASDYPNAKPPLVNDALNEYIPRTMIHNSVGIWKIENTFDCVQWLDQYVPRGSVILVDNRYRGLMLTKFDLDDRYIITTAWSEYWPSKSLDLAREKGFQNIYLIWNYQKWIKGFDRVYTSGNMAVYKAILPKTKK